jgi:dCMP deaminase
MQTKRTNYISWDEYFMGVALLSAKRSKDPSTQVGACIVNKQNKIVGAGYNGLPIGCSDDDFPWGKQGSTLETKYPYVCHAELNAILNNIGDLHGCRIYTALFPCNECTKAIIQSGIKEVVYLSDKYHATDSFIASKQMLDKAGVTYRKVENNIERIDLSFNEADV